jgi:hypothetical protein
MTMAAAKKTKRPFAIWFAQALLIFYLLIFAAVLVTGSIADIGVSYLPEGIFPTSVGTFLSQSLGVLMVLYAAYSFILLCFRVQAGRWLTIVFLAIQFLSFLAFMMSDEELKSVRYLQDPANILTLIFLIAFVGFPLLLAQFLLIFSPKAKSFFSPELESENEMNHLPPPPPEFD